MFEEKEWLVVLEAALYAAVSESTVRRWMREDGLPYFKGGGSNATVRIRKVDLEKFLERHMIRGESR